MYRLTAPVHVSWQVAAASVGIFVGIVLAAAYDLYFFATLGWFLTGIALVAAAMIRQNWAVVSLAVFGGMLIGVWRGSIEQSALTAYQPLYEKQITLRGVVSEDADIDKRGNLVVRLTNVQFGQHRLAGKLWITVDKNVPLQRSDAVTVRGILNPGFGTFSGSIYDSEVVQLERPDPGDVALKIRDWFADLIRRAIPEPESSLGIGYLVGQRRSLPEDLDTALRLAGLTHIVIASGYNLTILVRFSRRIFMKISKYTAALSSGILIASFIAITGFSPSMSRAGLIAGLSLAAWYYGRKFHPLVLLPFAAAITVLINPSYAWGDVGWQLSFTAFAGVMILAPLLQAYFFGPKKPGTLRQIVGETVAATIMTLPILLSTFGYVSNVALLANLLILPLVPLAMLLTFISGIGALIIAPLASAIGMPGYLLLHYMTTTAQWFAGLPWAITELEVGALHVIGLYLLTIIAMLYMWRVTRLNLRDSNLVE